MWEGLPGRDLIASGLITPNTRGKPAFFTEGNEDNEGGIFLVSFVTFCEI